MKLKNFTAEIVKLEDVRKRNAATEKYRYKSLTGERSRLLIGTRWREELLTHLKQKENGTVIRRHILRSGSV